MFGSNTRKIVSFLICAVFVLPLLAGCSSQEEKTPKDYYSGPMAGKSGAAKPSANPAQKN